MSSEYTSDDQQIRASVERTVRVFVSCTFWESIHEREELEKRVFPGLRRLCETHGVALESIDLGWGVLPTGGDPNEALSMRLYNISRCSYFIGILVEQYGTEFDTPNDSLLQQYPWLAHRMGRSFVELECVHGVLNEKSAARRAFFYLKAPNSVQAFDATRHHPDRVAVSVPEQSPESKLAALKQEVHGSGAVVREYVGLQALAGLVLGDLASAIGKDFPVSP